MWLRDATPTNKNHMERKIENEMEAGLIHWVYEDGNHKDLRAKRWFRLYGLQRQTYDYIGIQ